MEDELGNLAFLKQDLISKLERLSLERIFIPLGHSDLDTLICSPLLGSSFSHKC
jgi:hypothetical protein